MNAEDFHEKKSQSQVLRAAVGRELTGDRHPDIFLQPRLSGQGPEKQQGRFPFRLVPAKSAWLNALHYKVSMA